MADFLSNLSREELANIVRVFDIQIAVVLVLVAYLTKSLFAKFVLNVAFKFQKKREKQKAQDSNMFKALECMYVFIAVFLAIKIVPVGAKIQYIMGVLLKIAIIIFITKFITSVILVKDSKMMRKLFAKNNNEAVIIFVCKLLGIVAWIVSIFIIFAELGYDLSGLITGLGLGTAIISLAAQDTVKSLLSGVSILTDKPFVIGDWISVGTYAGTVKYISFRSTRIQCADNSIVTIPNSVITAEYVINWSKLTSRRFDCTLNLKLEETSEKIKKITREIKMVLSNKEYIDKSTIYVVFSKISSYSSDVKIFLYVKETDYFKYLKYQEDIYCSLLNILEKENIELAYPTETVHVRNVLGSENEKILRSSTNIENNENNN